MTLLWILLLSLIYSGGGGGGGVTFNNNGKTYEHVQNTSRVQKCRRAFYSINNVGMNYPGLNNIFIVNQS